MARHPFLFAGGEYLTTIGAAWFISYMWYNKVDKSHTNWKRVSTYNNRISTYNHTGSYHTFWLAQIVSMSARNLDKNTLGLRGYEIINMAKELSDK